MVLPPNPEDLILGSRGGAESEGAGGNEFARRCAHLLVRGS